jgi:hypothetical protein
MFDIVVIVRSQRPVSFMTNERGLGKSSDNARPSIARAADHRRLSSHRVEPFLLMTLNVKVHPPFAIWILGETMEKSEK